MFSRIALAAFVLTALLIAVHLVLTRIRGAREDRPVVPSGGYSLLLYLVVLMVGSALAVTGFGTAALQGQVMTGFPLMIHVSLGAGWLWLLLALALAWAEQVARGRDPFDRPLRLEQRVMFWLLVGLGPWVGLTALAAMTTWADTAGQHLLYELHRYGGLAWVVVAACHFYLMLVDGRSRRLQARCVSTDDRNGMAAPPAP